MEIKDLLPYFNGAKRHEGHKESVDLYESLCVHAEGRYPIDAIDKRRPSESEEIKNYRKEIFVPLAKETLSQIFNVAGKIRRSPDWMINFTEVEVPIAKGEGLYEYTMKNYPVFTSLEFWAFSVLMKNYFLDAGALILVEPLQTTVQENEYLKPIPIIFNSPNVLEYDVINNICILKETVKHEIEETTFIVVTNTHITRWKSSNSNWDKVEYEHGLGRMPIVKMPGRFLKSYKTYQLNESPIQTVAARMKEFVREYSDLQAEVVQHVHSETWQWANLPCKICEVSGISTGKVIDKKSGKRDKPCTSCHGTGTIASSPYTNMVVRGTKQSMNEQPAPIPPKGIIEKNTAIVTIQDARIERHAYKALESLNLHFLVKTPANQSGYAKDVDGQETQNTVYSWAEDIVWTLDKVFFLTNEYRYRVSITDQEKRNSLLPEIPIPEKYDLLSAMYLIDDLTKANTAKLNPVLINAMQVELVKKRFYYAPDKIDFLVAVLELDPMPGLTEDEKMVRVGNNGVSEINYIITCNIYTLVQKAVIENKGFLQMEKDKQMEILVGYAEEIKGEMSAAKEIKAEVEVEVPTNDTE